MCMTQIRYTSSRRPHLCKHSIFFGICLLLCVILCVWPLQDYLDAMVGVCYDGVEGVLYLCLFSTLAACAFTVMLCAIPRAWRQIACRWVRSLPAWAPSFPHPAAISLQLRVLYEPTSVCVFTIAQWPRLFIEIQHSLVCMQGVFRIPSLSS